MSSTNQSGNESDHRQPADESPFADPAENRRRIRRIPYLRDIQGFRRSFAQCEGSVLSDAQAESLIANLETFVASVRVPLDRGLGVALQYRDAFDEGRSNDPSGSCPDRSPQFQATLTQYNRAVASAAILGGIGGPIGEMRRTIDALRGNTVGEEVVQTIDTAVSTLIGAVLSEGAQPPLSIPSQS